VHAALATSWQAAPGNQRWQLPTTPERQISGRHACDPATVASCLRTANPSWKVLPDADSIVVERDRPAPNLPAELTLPRNAIAKAKLRWHNKRNRALSHRGLAAGEETDPGSEENCWRGRPFLDIVEIEMGRNFRDQLVGLELAEQDWSR